MPHHPLCPCGERLAVLCGMKNCRILPSWHPSVRPVYAHCVCCFHHCALRVMAKLARRRTWIISSPKAAREITSTIKLAPFPNRLYRSAALHSKADQRCFACSQRHQEHARETIKPPDFFPVDVQQPLSSLLLPLKAPLKHGQKFPAPRSSERRPGDASSSDRQPCRTTGRTNRV